MKSDKKIIKKVVINYPIGDFLIRLKNAATGGLKVVGVGKTRFIVAVAKALKKVGYLDDIEEKEGQIFVRLTYRKKEPILLDVKLVSKPGLRVYMGVEELEKQKGPSVLIISTPLGIMSATEAIKKRVGGEVIAKVL
jgi:small subunit ribosomal protein S8